MLSKRILTAILGLFIFYFFINWGSLPFFIINIILILLGLREFNLFIEKKYRSNLYILYFLGIIFSLYIYLNNINIIYIPFGFIFFLIIMFLFIYFQNKQGFENILISISLNLFAIIYIAGGLSFLVLLRDLKISFLGNTMALWLVLLASWVTDTGAYFTGRFLGKNKLAPEISPNKTIEGAAGGVFFSFLAVILFFWFYNIFNYYLILYAILIPVVAILGDLFESALKRDSGIKDSGNILPGHGGVLDRFDSVIFTIPFTYFYLVFVNLIIN
ncbi:MAG: phosphatidate cytidylyltransferase [Bacillota bacterium]